MNKKYKSTIILTTLLTLSPILAGLLLWNRLPDTIATHFGADNTANGWSSKPMTVFGLPLFLAGVHLLCVFFTMNDPKKKNISDKMFRIILWIVPAVSLFMCLSIYANALGIETNPSLISYLVIGLLFLFLGNYLPKCKQNYTAGIKLPWTLHSEENWIRTHRLAGWLFVAGGLMMVINCLLQWNWLLWAVLILVTIPEIVYSYLLFRKGI
ncbi:MAG: SdpI family protein [Fusicatenibacter sp.]|nr:SdpI family protein [Fusicatenibacter sp.]